MIIDFHTHVFPDALAHRAVARLAANARAKNYLSGTTDALQRSMREAGIDYSVLLPVATKPGQHDTINRIAVEINAHTEETGILSFGSIHPADDDFRRILRNLAGNGVKGIKLHPVSQQTDFDDISYLRIVDYACENNLIIFIHAGYDIGYPGREHASVPHIISVLDRLHPEKLVLAHMGGWAQWNEVEEFLVGRNVWLDTAFSLLPVLPAPGTFRAPDETPLLSREQFLRIVRRHGAHRILFGTDSPWSSQPEVLGFLNSLVLPSSEQAADKIYGQSPEPADEGASGKAADSLTETELSAILGGNAAKLLRPMGR